MTDQLKNQQKYEREARTARGFTAWQCALMVWGVVAVFSGVVYLFS